MAFTNETKNYGLPDWIGPDKPTWLVDMNNAFETIDNQMKSNETSAMQAKQIGESAMDTAGNAVEATHTNAAAISALTASLAETDTRVDRLTPPQTTLLKRSGQITGFGWETLNAIYINEHTVLYLLAVYGTQLTKNTLIDVPDGSGVPSKMAKVFPGKIPLFGNSIDPAVGEELARFFITEQNGTGLCTVIIYRGTDGYYYAMPEDSFNNMSDGSYIVLQWLSFTRYDTSWPTT